MRVFSNGLPCSLVKNCEKCGSLLKKKSYCSICSETYDYDLIGICLWCRNNAMKTLENKKCVFCKKVCCDECLIECSKCQRDNNQRTCFCVKCSHHHQCVRDLMFKVIRNMSKIEKFLDALK
jgi:hypothetical protein